MINSIGKAALVWAVAAYAGSATAASVTYTISGALTQSQQGGPQGAALAAALGAPSSYVANFTVDLAAPDQDPSATYGGYNISLSDIKLDGVSFFTGQPAQTYFQVTTFGNVYFYTYLQTDRVPSVSQSLSFGNAPREAVVFRASINFNPPTGSQSIPTGNFGSIFNSSVEASYTSVPIQDFNNQQFAARLGTVSSIVATVNPVPEPGEWAMMVSGLAVVGAVARRRRKV